MGTVSELKRHLSLVRNAGLNKSKRRTALLLKFEGKTRRSFLILRDEYMQKGSINKGFHFLDIPLSL